MKISIELKDKIIKSASKIGHIKLFDIDTKLEIHDYYGSDYNYLIVFDTFKIIIQMTSKKLVNTFIKEYINYVNFVSSEFSFKKYKDGKLHNINGPAWITSTIYDENTAFTVLDLESYMNAYNSMSPNPYIRYYYNGKRIRCKNLKDFKIQVNLKLLDKK